MQVRLDVPITTVSEGNNTDHWTKKRKRRILISSLIKIYWKNSKTSVKIPCIVKMTRISPRRLDDDNLRAALKSARDTIANLIIPGKAPGQADNDSRIEWQYDQKKEQAKQMIRIEIFN